jgi:four helix bundle protein
VQRKAKIQISGMRIEPVSATVQIQIFKEVAGMKISRFEDLIAWQKSRELFKIMHKMISQKPLSANYPMRDQMTRSSLSVMSNIAEGFDRGGNREFIQFLYVSKGSCSELRSQLFAAKDAGYLSQEDFSTLYNLADEISRIIHGLIEALKRSQKKGNKFAPVSNSEL